MEEPGEGEGEGEGKGEGEAEGEGERLREGEGEEGGRKGRGRRGREEYRIFEIILFSHAVHKAVLSRSRLVSNLLVARSLLRTQVSLVSIICF